jgi:hypothetical protein
MANTLTSIMPKILARSLRVLRERCVMARAVNFDYSDEAKAKGTTIDVPISSAVAVIDVTPAVTNPTPTMHTPGLVQIALDKWKQTEPIALTDKELEEIDANAHFLPDEMSEGMKSLANAINQDVFTHYWGVYGYYGTAGTTPFASDVLGATQTRKILNQQLAPLESRRGIVDHDCEANMLALSAFANAEKTMSNQVVMKGEIGEKYGINWMADDHVPYHTAGVPGGTPAVNGAHSAALTSLTSTVAINGGGAAGTYTRGDIITFAGHTQTYTVTEAETLSGGGAGDLIIAPGLKVALAGGELISLKASHRVNMVFHRDAFALAMRPLLEAGKIAGDLGPKMAMMQDPLTGLVIRLEAKRLHKQNVWEFDALWGAKLVRAALATRLAG